MGYTHTYRIHDLTADLHVDGIAQDAHNIILAAEAPVAGPDGIPGTQPQLGPRVIDLNGESPQDGDNFHYPPQDPFGGMPPEIAQAVAAAIPPGQEFCKTDYKPYDAIVCAVLIAIRHHLGGNVRVWSDGKLDEPEMAAGLPALPPGPPESAAQSLRGARGPGGTGQRPPGGKPLRDRSQRHTGNRQDKEPAAAPRWGWAGRPKPKSAQIISADNPREQAPAPVSFGTG